MLRVFRIEVEKFESELLLLDVSDKGPGFRLHYQIESKGEQSTMPKVKKL